jgi:hypothetical protein
MLRGNTLFAGDSMTVGLPPFVQIDGVKTMVASVGRTASQLFAALQAPNVFDGVANMVVLIGANDIGGGRTVASLFDTIVAIWGLAKRHGARVFALTMPPARGWSGFGSNFPAIDARRKALNGLIASSPVPDQIIDLSALMADPRDPSAMSPAFDSGDHLHPRKDATGVLLNRTLFAGPSPSPAPAPSGTPAGPGVVASGVQVPLGRTALVAAGAILLVLGARYFYTTGHKRMMLA